VNKSKAAVSLDYMRSHIFDVTHNALEQHAGLSHAQCGLVLVQDNNKVQNTQQIKNVDLMKS